MAAPPQPVTSLQDIQDGAEARIVHISAEDRASGTAGAGQYRLAGNITLGRSSLARFHLVSASLPRSWYNIPQGNNMLNIAVTDTTGPTTTDYAIAIPPANYDAYTLSAALQTILQADPISLADATVTYDQPTDLITIATGVDTELITLLPPTSASDPSKVAQALGFYNIALGATPRYTVYQPTAADTITGNNSPMLDVEAISIHSSLAQPGYCNGVNAAVIAVINLSGSQGSTVNWQATGPPVEWDITSNQISGFNLFYMRRDIMQGVDFRGQNPTVEMALYSRR